MSPLMRRALVALVALAVVALPQPAAAADRPPDRCAKPKSRTVRANPSIRVYRLHSALWGCRQRTGRTMRLDDALSCGSIACSGSSVAAINGRWVALVHPGTRNLAEIGGPADAYLQLADVVERRTRMIYRTETGPIQYADIPEAAVTPGGRLAWMTELRELRSSEPSRSIHVAGASGQFMVDQGGSEIGERSLAISGTRAYWMHGDEPRSAVLP
jgi:hypothetical protein